MKRIYSIAKNTFREAIRDRILYNLVLFVLLLTVCAVLLGDLTDGQESRTIVNISLNAILLFGVFIAIFVGVGLVSKEIEKKTVYGLLAKPIRRGEFIIGKYLGLGATLAVNTAVMGLGVTLALVYVKGSPLIGPVWASILLIFFELMIVTAVAIVFSSFSTPALSALLTFLVFVIGHLSASLRDFSSVLKSPFAGYVLEAIYYLLPNLSIFSFRTEAALGLFPGPPMMIGAFVYALAYAMVMITIAILIFSRRDFK